MASRRRARRFSLQILYALDHHAKQIEHDVSACLKELDFGTEDNDSFVKAKNALPFEVRADVKALYALTGSIREEAVQKLFIKSLSLCASQQIEYLWFLQLEVNTLDSKKVPPFKGSQRERFDNLLKEHVRIEEAVSLALDSALHSQYQELCLHCHLPPYVAYWVVKHQSDVLSDIPKTDLKLEELGQLLQYVVEGAMLESQMLNLLNRYLEAHHEFINKRRIGEEEIEPPKLPIEGIELKPVEKHAFESSLSFAHDAPVMEDRKPVEPDEILFVEELVSAVCDNWFFLNQTIEKASTSWAIERMSQIDRSILRIAICELARLTADVPARVSIDEAIRLAKHFSELGRERAEIEQGRQWTETQIDIEPKRARTRGASVVEVDLSSNGGRSDRGRRTHDASRFINGILDRVAKDFERTDLHEIQKSKSKRKSRRKR